MASLSILAQFAFQAARDAFDCAQGRLWAPPEKRLGSG
jgi:hypothetical protein